MSYATQQDLVDRFGSAELAGLTDPVAGSTINATTVTRALTDADAEIDTRLSARYDTPLATVPAVIVRLAADLARYFLWDVRATEQVRNRYKDAVALLDKISKGDVMVPGATLLTPAAGSVAVGFSSSTTQFSSTLLDSFGAPQ
jgi:phage gp36-like protein